MRNRLSIAGIFPRHPFGLTGIICAPFLHANWGHLFFNTVPLFILANLVLIYGRVEFYQVTAIIIVLGGLATWVLGRKAIHLGASGLIMGYWGFLLLQSYYHPSILAVFVGVICLYYLGGLFLSLFPSGKGVSWESHVFGFLAGMVAVQLVTLPAFQNI